jgi:sec-independent protein translocase protein TatC
MADQKQERLEEMDFIDHLEELRSALIAVVVAWLGSSIVLWFFSARAVDFLLNNIPLDSLYFHAPVEAFVVRLKLSFILGFLVSFPYILFRIWRFVAPGLFSRERRVVVPLVSSSTVLFYIGVGFAYWILIPVVLDFLIGFGTEMINPLISVDKYFLFVARLCFAFGVVFQLPIIVIFLTWMGVISPVSVLKQWRWATVIIFTFGAILTPPDPASQILMAVPLLMLFLGSLALSIFIERRKNSNKSQQNPGGD